MILGWSVACVEHCLFGILNHRLFLNAKGLKTVDYDDAKRQSQVSRWLLVSGFGRFRSGRLRLTQSITVYKMIPQMASFDDFEIFHTLNIGRQRIKNLLIRISYFEPFHLKNLQASWSVRFDGTKYCPEIKIGNSRFCILYSSI